MAIGKIECTCRRCGCTFTVRRDFRNRTAADEWEAWAEANGEYDLCSDCYREEQIEIAADKNKQHGMPELTGTPKQIAWAEKIREKSIARFEHDLSLIKQANPEATPDQLAEFDAKVTDCMQVFRGLTAARQWIDTRDEDPMRWVCKQLQNS